MSDASYYVQHYWRHFWAQEIEDVRRYLRICRTPLPPNFSSSHRKLTRMLMHRKFWSCLQGYLDLGSWVDGPAYKTTQGHVYSHCLLSERSNLTKEVIVRRSIISAENICPTLQVVCGFFHKRFSIESFVYSLSEISHSIEIFYHLYCFHHFYMRRSVMWRCDTFIVIFEKVCYVKVWCIHCFIFMKRVLREVAMYFVVIFVYRSICFINTLMLMTLGV